MRLHDPTLMTGLLDGELKGWRRWYVRRHASKCPVCALEYRQQQHARRLLAANPPNISMSGSDDFFWSQIKNEIQSRPASAVDVPTPSLSFGDWLRQRELALATVAATIVALLAITWLVSQRRAHPQFAHAQVEHVQTAIPNTVATPFRSDDDVTVIWVSGLPWTPDMTEMQTLYAQPTI